MRGRAYEAVWGRVFATVYNPAFALAERRGLRSIRREVVGRAMGRVLELGAGTGLNLTHYSDGVSELILTEPDLHMAAQLRRRARTASAPVSILDAPAESLPVGDSTIDSVISTLVLCTVQSPVQTLMEIDRVLRPGGSFLFVEHVRSTSAQAARWQDRLNRSWSWYACGCQCNRDTLATIEESPLNITAVRRDNLRWISPLVRPLVVGRATKGVTDCI